MSIKKKSKELNLPKEKKEDSGIFGMIGVLLQLIIFKCSFYFRKE